MESKNGKVSCRGVSWGVQVLEFNATRRYCRHAFIEVCIIWTYACICNIIHSICIRKKQALYYILLYTSSRWHWFLRHPLSHVRVNAAKTPWSHHKWHHIWCGPAPKPAGTVTYRCKTPSCQSCCLTVRQHATGFQPTGRNYQLLCLEGNTIHVYMYVRRTSFWHACIVQELLLMCNAHDSVHVVILLDITSLRMS